MRIQLTAAAGIRKGPVVEVLEYLGVVLASNLITSSALAAYVGLTSGTRADSDWIKFKRGSKVRYISKGPMRYGMSWNQLNAAGVVLGKTFNYGGKQYVCRLLQGAEIDPTESNVNDDDCEFNELFYSISTGRDPSYTGPRLEQLSATTLGFMSGNGFSIFCKESRIGSPTAKLRRNSTKGNIRTGSFAGDTYISNESGWWPVLEEVV